MGISLGQRVALGVFIAFAIWSTGRGIVGSMRERRRLSKRKSYSLGLDVAALLLSSSVGLGGGALVMLALDHFGLMRWPYMWLSAVPLLAAWIFGNRLREKVERHRLHERKRRQTV